MVFHCGATTWSSTCGRGARVKRGRRGLILPPHAIGVAVRAAWQMLEGSVGYRALHGVRSRGAIDTCCASHGEFRGPILSIVPPSFGQTAVKSGSAPRRPRVNPPPAPYALTLD
jgi:hypothetical protein